MGKDEAKRLLYKVTKKDKSIEVTKVMPMKSKDKILHVLWWYDNEVLLRTSKLVTTEDWLQLTE
eukprot:7278611-Ditylum_brightwellii.AAC.1